MYRLEPDGAALARSGAELELEWAPVHLQLASLPKYYLMLSKVRTSHYLHNLEQDECFDELIFVKSEEK
jgi:hypothetical protein